MTVGATDVPGKDVQLPLGMHITGRITGPGGTPPLTQANAGASNGAWADTDSNGDYSIAVLPGDYMVWFNDNSNTYVNGCWGATGFTTARFGTPASARSSLMMPMMRVRLRAGTPEPLQMLVVELLELVT